MKNHLHQSQQLKPVQRLILSPQMQQALHLLQLPIRELSTLIEDELAQNPLLELGEEGEDQLWEMLKQMDEQIRPPSCQGEREEEDLKAFIENTLAYEHSLFDLLMEQAKEVFSDPETLKLAEYLLGHLDSDGFLTTPLEEIALLTASSLELLKEVLKTIQTFEPAGVGAQTLQESLLIQLKAMGKEDTLTFRMVAHHYDDLIHNRIPLIAKALGKKNEEIHKIITDQIVHLDLHPGTNLASGHYRQLVQHLIPDVAIHYEKGRFAIEVNEENIPSLRLNHHYLKMLEDKSLNEEARSYIQEKILSGKWLLRNLYERHQTLYRITSELIKSQNAFFRSSKGKLSPLTMKEVAEKLELHESTIARAVANKYISCPRGILPLRSFFTHAYLTEQGESISAQTVKDLLRHIIAEEDRHRPLSDEIISSMIKKEGIPCARRTVAKYRQQLGIGNTVQRKIH
ncbi:MAG: RNA polymerase factor sigma-54 [Chlamydiales bacterium]